jgi:putative membrane protein
MFWADGPWQAGAGGGPACLIVGLLVVGALIAGGLWWWKRRSKPKPGSGSGSPGAPGAERPSAEDILAERYARGDITDDEYMQRQSVLREGRSG